MNRAKTFFLAMMMAAGAQVAAAQTVGQGSAAPGAPLVRVRYMVHDIGHAVDFYRDKLGFRVDFRSGPYFAALSRGGVQLLLSPTRGPGAASQPMPNGDKPIPGGWNRLVLNTPDLKADVARLRAEGVRFRNDVVVGLGGDEVLLDDPSGNVIELFQPTQDLAQRKP